MKDIHSSGFAHLDLKPENIVYDPVKNKITIIDFGVCLPFNLDINAPKGTLLYNDP